MRHAKSYLQPLFWVRFHVLALLAMAGLPVHADSVLNPLKVETIDALIDIVLKAIITIGVPVLLFFMILTGFYFVTAQGSQGKLDKAKAMLLWTIVGGAVVLGAKVLHELLKDTLNQLNV